MGSKNGDSNATIVSVADALSQDYGVFDRQPHSTVKDMLSFLRSSVRDNGFETILDIGCGVGSVTRLIAGFFDKSQIIGVDISREMLNKADNIRMPNLRYVLADASGLPFEKSTVSCAVLINSWHLMRDRTAVVNELRRVLAPNGTVMVVGIERDKLKYEFFHQQLPNFHKKDYQQHDSLDSLISRFNENGFTYTDSKTYAYSTRIGNAEETLSFLVRKPFFSLRLLTDEEFESDLRHFRRWLAESEIKETVKNGVSTLAIFKKEG
ncbi:MAG: class I SAM-dependent methyltransferase [Clostridiales bacterium]|jgi:ubiquinone/menaquinone biosynthesis C-methylase UbiE|nr:class I SAM-dependent methyltransferase [Clostridiales bacterium]